MTQKVIDDIERLLKGIDIEESEKEIGVCLHQLIPLLTTIRHSNNEYHHGETIIEHIDKVVGAIDIFAKDHERKNLLYYVALFHDLGKAYTYEVTDGQHTFYGHTDVSEGIAIVMTEDWDDKEYILDMVRLHDVISEYGHSFSKKIIRRVMNEKIYLDGKIGDLILFFRMDSYAANEKTYDVNAKIIECFEKDIIEYERERKEAIEKHNKREAAKIERMPLIKKFLEEKAAYAVSALPDYKEVNRRLGQNKDISIIKEIERMLG